MHAVRPLKQGSRSRNETVLWALCGILFTHLVLLGKLAAVILHPRRPWNKEERGRKKKECGLWSRTLRSQDPVAPIEMVSTSAKRAYCSQAGSCILCKVLCVPSSVLDSMKGRQQYRQLMHCSNMRNNGIYALNCAAFRASRACHSSAGLHKHTFNMLAGIKGCYHPDVFHQVGMVRRSFSHADGYILKILKCSPFQKCTYELDERPK